jgi:hypothetical protein
MRRLALAAAFFIPAATPAMAQQPTAKPEMVLIPRVVAEEAASWIRHPDINTHIDLYAAIGACLADNPHDGVLRRMGADQCQSVTDAIAARDKEIADLKKQVDDLKAANPSK